MHVLYAFDKFEISRHQLFKSISNVLIFSQRIENDKLNKFKAEVKIKSKKSDFFNSYLEKTNNIDDKIALIKFKYKMLISNKLLFFYIIILLVRIYYL